MGIKGQDLGKFPEISLMFRRPKKGAYVLVRIKESKKSKLRKIRIPWPLNISYTELEPWSRYQGSNVTTYYRGELGMEYENSAHERAPTDLAQRLENIISMHLIDMNK